MTSLLLSALLARPGAMTLQVDRRPRVLIVQRASAPDPDAAKKVNPPVDAPVAMLLAGEVENAGRAATIVWSSSDPVFRDARESGKIAPPAAPSDDDVRKVAKTLGCRYTITVVCTIAGNRAAASLRLDGDAKYEVSESSEIAMGGAGGADAAIESVARVLGLRLDSGPFKKLRKIAAADPAVPGQLDPPSNPPASPPANPPTNPPPVNPPTTNPPTTDPPATNPPATNPPAANPPAANPIPPAPLANAPQQAERLIQERKLRAAIFLLRDAVDADPFDPARRVALLRALRLGGFVEEALAAARAALAMLPDATLRIESARVMVAAGRGEEARAAMNEALARDPKDRAAHALLGEIALRAGDPGSALPHLDAALAEAEKKDDKALASIYRLRAAARALLGGADGVELDWKRADEGQPADPETTEGEVFEIVDAALATEGPTLRLLFQKAVLKRESPEIIEGIEAQERLVASLLALSRLAGTSVRFASPRDTRALALNLLRQCMGELRDYVASGKEDDLGDARITLGEALRNLAAARAAQAALRTSDGRPG